MGKELYVSFWRSKRSQILKGLKYAVNGEQHIQISEDELEKLGNRKSSGYTFNLEFSNGIQTKNISNSAVARDLCMALEENTDIRNILKEGNYKINMGVDYCLKINKLS